MGSATAGAVVAAACLLAVVAAAWSGGVEAELLQLLHTAVVVCYYKLLGGIGESDPSRWFGCRCGGSEGTQAAANLCSLIPLPCVMGWAARGTEAIVDVQLAIYKTKYAKFWSFMTYQAVRGLGKKSKRVGRVCGLKSTWAG